MTGLFSIDRWKSAWQTAVLFSKNAAFEATKKTFGEERALQAVKDFENLGRK